MLGLALLYQTTMPFLLPLSSTSPSISSSPSASTSSSSYTFFAGGTLLRSHERSPSDSLTSLSPNSFKFRSRAFSNRFGLLISASGDYYATLGVPKSANGKQIKAAYRNLARQYHPDVSKEPGATEKFKEISAAYEVLSEERKRALYDQYGEVGVKSTVGGQSGAFTVWELLYLCYILCLFFFVVISFGVLLYNGKS